METNLHDANETRNGCYNYDLQETLCINYYANPLAVRQAYTADPEYLSLVEVEVEVVFIGNTIGVSTPFGTVDAS
jgi:hypothetical protein